jgi:hypothetical protein
MHSEDQTITDTIAAYERLRAFVDERVTTLVHEEIDLSDEVHNALRDTDISEYVDVDELDIESKIEEGVSNELDNSLDDRVIEGIENYMSMEFDIDAKLEDADISENIKVCLPEILGDPKTVHMIRTALAEVPAPEEDA